MVDEAQIQARLKGLQDELAVYNRPVTVVVATKYLPSPALPILFELGVRDFGESRVQDALDKQAWLSEQLGEARAREIHWHFIGHLQRNKAAKTLGESGPRFGLIHTLDSLELAERLSAANAAAGWVQPILWQVNLTDEAQKYGLPESQLLSHFEGSLALPGIIPRGLMCFGAPSNNPHDCDAVFARLKRLGDSLHERFGGDALDLSMGMSSDYGSALKNGATIIRIGRLLLGEDSH